MTISSNAASRYTQLESDRQSFLDRAREAALLTIPSLMVPEGHTSASKLQTPFQGLGARGVNHLGSKLMLALFPPNAPFFKLPLDDKTLSEMTDDEALRSKIEEALNKVERSVVREIEASKMRSGLYEAIKQLIVVGNVLLYFPRKGGIRIFRLDRFVVLRDPMGEILEIVVKEDIAPTALPKEVKDAIQSEGKNSLDTERSVALYTWIRRTDTDWKIHQEAKDITIPGSEGSYALDQNPWVPLRWTRIDGESYGRSHCDEYLGDLKSLEGLSKAIVEGTAAAARVIPLVDPNGITDERDLSTAENLEFVSGREQDVSILQIARAVDFNVARETAAEIAQRLSFAFMLNSAIQRGGERVTAEEIRYMAGELEDALGGVYTILAQELQLPLVSRVMQNMQRAKKLPKLPNGAVTPTITTGLEALGRGHDLQKLDLFLAGLANVLGQEALQAELNGAEYITRRATALGINTTGLLKTEEQKAADQQQQQMLALIQQLGPNIINQLGGMAQNTSGDA
jgi:hypothetical protein